MTLLVCAVGCITAGFRRLVLNKTNPRSLHLAAIGQYTAYLIATDAEIVWTGMGDVQPNGQVGEAAVATACQQCMRRIHLLWRVGTG